MAPSRVSKNSGHFRRKQQSIKIALFGKVMAPCSRCEELNLVCYVHGLYPRCNECEKANAKCDGTMSEVEWTQLQQKKAETQRLIDTERKRIADASKIIADASKEMTEGVARITKLEADLKGIGNRQEVMLAREGASLDFLDPPQEWISDGSSPTFSQVLADLGAGGGIGQESSCP
jgi:hypothetical protein